MIVVDVNMTPENAWEYGYKWVADLFQVILDGSIRNVEDFEDKKLWMIGKAKGENQILGFYKPMNANDKILIKNIAYVKKELLNFPIDQTLNPQTANAMGYRWIEDFVYDTSQEMERNLYDIMKSLVEDGFKIGKAKEPVGYLDKGWYAPLKKDQG